MLLLYSNEINQVILIILTWPRSEKICSVRGKDSLKLNDRGSVIGNLVLAMCGVRTSMCSQDLNRGKWYLADN